MRAHHTLNPWPYCWKCNKSLGCAKCVPNAITDVACEVCMVWGTLPALLLHGPLVNNKNQLWLRHGKQAPPLSHYPPHWQARYRRDEEEFQQGLMTPLSAEGKGIMGKVMDILKKGESVPYENIIIKAWDRNE